MPSPATHNFDNNEQLALALATSVAENLRASIATRGTALLAVSGGKTPVHFFHALSRQKLDWSKVVVTLVDERWLPPTEDRSNEHFVRENLLQNEAAAAQFVSLYEANSEDPDEVLTALSMRVMLLDLPFDALVLGMGDDGHTASFFPGGDHLAQATDLNTQALIVTMRAPNAGEPRVTLTLPVIVQSRNLYLHIEGAQKRRVLWDATNADANDDKLPISIVLRNARTSLQIYWCP
jgi:6-phosphogluconolactonase